MIHCPSCQHSGAIDPTCPTCARRAYEAINCTGAIVPLHVYEDAEQQAVLDTVTLPYAPATNRVTRGPYRGQDVGVAAEAECFRLTRCGYRLVSIEAITCRPWWRLWRETPALLVRPGPQAEV